MSRFTYWISAILALVGTGTAIHGICQPAGQTTGEGFKQTASGLVLILAASVFSILYLGTRRILTPPVSSPVDTDTL
jgi:hypothetical protein